MHHLSRSTFVTIVILGATLISLFAGWLAAAGLF